MTLEQAVRPSDSWRLIDPAVLADTSCHQRFWQYVKITDGCWEWTGSKFASPYGPTYYGNFKPRRNMSPVPAHRYWYQVLHGPLTRHQHVCHRCDNRACVRPDHLFLGDHKTNMADRNAKERQARGSRSGVAKITEADAAAIREQVATGRTQVDVAREYGLHKTMVSLIVRRKNWAHVH